MEDIEIEYLDEYKDLVLPGIKTSGEGRAATTASLNQAAASRSSQRRRTSSDSSSSSIDPDIFQKLFDGKFLDDELLNESGSSAKGRFRRSLSSSSSDSNDGLDVLYNRHSSRKFKSTKRDRLDSYDSLDDLGDALMGSTHKLSLHKGSSKKSHTVKTKSDESKAHVSKPSSSSSSTTLNPSSNGSRSTIAAANPFQSLSASKKKAVTIIKAPKVGLKPSKLEPKQDPLHLQDYNDDTDSDTSSYEYESDFYDCSDDDDDDGSSVGGKQIIHISTDSSTTTSVADTVTPVVSEDEEQLEQQQQQLDSQQQQPNSSSSNNNERLHSYLNNLSCAETPPSSRHKYKYNAKKSRSSEKTPPTPPPPPQEQVNQTLDEVKREIVEEPSSSRRQLFNDSEKVFGADYVDDNLTYETVERLSHNLAEQIINIDAERSVEFAKRSASKPRSSSSSKIVGERRLNLSLSSSHVRKLTYSNESLNKTATVGSKRLRRAKSDGAFTKRKRNKSFSKKRNSLTEEKIQFNPLTPTKNEPEKEQQQLECNLPKKIPETTTTTETELETLTDLQLAKKTNRKAAKLKKRKRGRPRKNRIFRVKAPINDNNVKSVIETEMSANESLHKSAEEVPSQLESRDDTEAAGTRDDAEAAETRDDTEAAEMQITPVVNLNDSNENKEIKTVENNATDEEEEEEQQKQRICEATETATSIANISNEHTEKQVENETQAEQIETEAEEIAAVHSVEQCQVAASVEQTINESGDKVEQTENVTGMEEEQEAIDEEMELNDLEQENNEAEISEEQMAEEKEEEEKEEINETVEFGAEKVMQETNLEDSITDESLAESEENLEEKEESSARNIRETLRSAMANPSEENITEDTADCKEENDPIDDNNKAENQETLKETPMQNTENQTEMSIEEKTEQQQEFTETPIEETPAETSIDSPTQTASNNAEINTENQSNITEKQTPSKQKKKKSIRSPKTRKSGTKRKSRIKFGRTRKKKKATVLPETKLDDNKEANDSNCAPTEEQQINVNETEIIEENMPSDEQITEIKEVPCEVDSTNDKETPLTASVNTVESAKIKKISSVIERKRGRPKKKKIKVGVTRAERRRTELQMEENVKEEEECVKELKDLPTSEELQETENTNLNAEQTVETMETNKTKDKRSNQRKLRKVKETNTEDNNTLNVETAKSSDPKETTENSSSERKLRSIKDTKIDDIKTDSEETPKSVESVESTETIEHTFTERKLRSVKELKTEDISLSVAATKTVEPSETNETIENSTTERKSRRTKEPKTEEISLSVETAAILENSSTERKLRSVKEPKTEEISLSVTATKSEESVELNEVVETALIEKKSRKSRSKLKNKVDKLEKLASKQAENQMPNLEDSAMQQIVLADQSVVTEANENNAIIENKVTEVQKVELINVESTINEETSEKPSETIEELLETDNSVSKINKTKPRTLLLREIRGLKLEASDLEALTNRTRANTPSTRLGKSREKEFVEKDAKESSRSSRVIKAVSFTEAAKQEEDAEKTENKADANLEVEKTIIDTEEANKTINLESTEKANEAVNLEHSGEANKGVNLEQEANKSSAARKNTKKSKSRSGKSTKKTAEIEAETEVNSDVELPTFVQPLAACSGGSTTPLNTETEAVSTPSSSSSSHSTRKLRVLVKKSTPTSQKLEEAAEHVREAADADTIQESTAIAELEEQAVVASAETEKPTTNTEQMETEKVEKPAEVAVEIAGQEQQLETPPIAAEMSSSSPTGTTGVSTKEDEMIEDDLLPDEKKRQQLQLQTKLSMAPPAVPKRELISGKAALRRPERSGDLDLQPEQKRRKLAGQLDKKKTDIDNKKTASPVNQKTHKLNAAKKSLAIETLKKTLPIESSKTTATNHNSSALHSKKAAEKSPLPVLDNSVIITKTAINTTKDALKATEQLPSKLATSSGINISVTVVTDANKPLTSTAASPKKILTQAETAKMIRALTSTPAMMESNATAAISTGISNTTASKLVKGSLEEAKKSTAIVAANSKTASKLAKGSLEEAKKSAAVSQKKSCTQTHKKKFTKSKIDAATMKVMEGTAIATATAAATASIAATKVPLQQELKDKSATTAGLPDKKLTDTKKANKKSLNKLKTKQTMETTTAATVSSLSPSLESAKESSKRSGRALKTMAQSVAAAHVTRASSISRLATATTATAATATVSEQLALPQRQPRRSLLQKLPAAESSQTGTAATVLQTIAQPEQQAVKTNSSNSRKRKLPAEQQLAKRAKEQLMPAVAFPVRITAASAVPLTKPSSESSPATAVKRKEATTQQQLPHKLRKLRVRLNRSIVEKWQQQQLQQLQQQAATQSKFLPAKPKQLPSVPLPVPLPVLEVKAEQEAVQQEEEPSNNTTLPEQPPLLEANVATTSLLQVVAPQPRTVSNPTATVASSDSNNSSIATTSLDALSFGTTRMFSFLYPTRYQRTYANVGLDFCCPNLDGPMQAIDPTRLHSKVQVPVLELPQYMVISTKIISKQDKNIPQKVRAKLEQLAANASSGQLSPTNKTASIVSATPTAAPTVVPAPLERLSKPLPRGPILTKQTHPLAATTSAAVAPTVSSSTPPVSDIFPGLLQLPPVCPTDKMRVELQTRVQIFDAVLQGLARRAAAMSVLERQRVIETIVSTSSLMPIDVDVGTKLLENYICYLNAATDTLPMTVPRIRSIISSRTAQPAGSRGREGNTVVTPQGAVNSGSKVGVGGATGIVSGTPDSKQNSNKRPIYDKDRIIGYQYTTPKVPINPVTSRAQAIKQQNNHLMMTSTATSSKLAVVNAVASSSTSSSNANPYQSSAVPKSFATKSPAVPAALDRTSSSSCSTAVAVSTTAKPAHSRNVFIVNQILSTPEECILPDAVGAPAAAALESEIKGEFEEDNVLI